MKVVFLPFLMCSACYPLPKLWTVPCPCDVTRFAYILRRMRRRGPRERTLKRCICGLRCPLGPHVIFNDCALRCLHCCLEWVIGVLPSSVSAVNCACYVLLAVSVCRRACAHQLPLDSSGKNCHALLHTSNSPSAFTEQHGSVPSWCRVCLTVYMCG